MTLSLIQTSKRGSPTEINDRDKRKIRSLNIPHVKLEESILASEIQGVREFGSTDALVGARAVVDKAITKQVTRHDLTLENLRLGALRGLILDADGSTIYNLFTEFGVSAPSAVDFGDSFAGNTGADSVRVMCQNIVRTMKRNLNAPWSTNIKVWAFCGQNFLDGLVEAPSVKGTYDGYAAAERKLGDNYAHGIFEYAGVFFEEYQGTDDQSSTTAGSVGIDPDECQFFLTGVPGLYAEYYAPADFMETVNTLGLPRYAKVAQSDKFNRGVALHTQQNPLPLCLRPKTLLKGTL